MAGKQLALVGIVAAVALAGCGSGGSATVSVPQGSPPAGSASTPPASPPPGAVVDTLQSSTTVRTASPQPLPAATTPSDSHYELKSVTWTLANAKDNRQTLVISYPGSGCEQPAGVKVTQTSAYVMVGTYVRVAKPTSQPMACPQFAIIVTGTVHLDAPLGKRRLYHEPTG
ncbi:MAG: hypothetical protein ACJ735_09760 [Actinomycetes bacterium]